VSVRSEQTCDITGDSWRFFVFWKLSLWAYPLVFCFFIWYTCVSSVFTGDFSVILVVCALVIQFPGQQFGGLWRALVAARFGFWG
jgi:hypothetical protein